MTEVQIHIRKATLKDYPQVLGILTKVGLPIEGVASQLKHFLIAEYQGDLIGVCGVYVVGTKGWLRSMAVVSAFRSKGVGRQLFDASLKYVRELGLDELYVLIKTNKDYFLNLGFEDVSRDKLPVSLQAMLEFAELYDNADCLRLMINASK